MRRPPVHHRTVNGRQSVHSSDGRSRRSHRGRRLRHLGRAPRDDRSPLMAGPIRHGSCEGNLRRRYASTWRRVRTDRAPARTDHHTDPGKGDMTRPTDDRGGEPRRTEASISPRRRGTFGCRFDGVRLDYTSGRDHLLRLRKGNPPAVGRIRRIDWSTDVDHENPLGARKSIMIFGAVLGSMNAHCRGAGPASQAWQFSQFCTVSRAR